MANDRGWPCSRPGAARSGLERARGGHGQQIPEVAIPSHSAHMSQAESLHRSVLVGVTWSVSPPVIVSGLSCTKPKGVVVSGNVLPSPSFELVLAPINGFTNPAASWISPRAGRAQTDAAAGIDNPANLCRVIFRGMKSSLPFDRCRQRLNRSASPFPSIPIVDLICPNPGVPNRGLLFF